MPKTKQPPEWVARFLEYISGERAYAQNTVDAYRRDLMQFNAGLKKPFFLVSSDR